MTERKHIDPTIYTTRPTDERLEKENRVYDLLEELNIPFMDQEVVDQPLIGCHPCINTSSLTLSTNDVLNKFLPYTNHDVLYVNL